MKLCIIIALAAFGLSAFASPGETDLALIVQRQRAFLLDQTRSENAIETTQRWLATLAPDGHWPDIDYADKSPGNWKTLEHLKRIRDISLEIASAKSPLHNNTHALASLGRALRHWTDARYQNPNWWQNRIGVPQVTADILVLLGERLPAALRDDTTKILRQYAMPRPGGAANTLWSAEIGLIDGALGNDTSKVLQAATLIAGEITQGGNQGIQHDFSFHQHGARLQQFHYGRAFLNIATRLAWLLRGTAYQLPRGKVTLLADYALEGCAWMSRAGTTVPGAIDRAVSRPGALENAALDRELAMLRELIPEHIAKAGPPRGFRAFPNSDFFVYHNNEYSFFLKTVSTRTEFTETINGENLKGRKLNWGDHYIVRDGREYTGLPPVWNWELLPGVTSFADTTKLIPSPMVGSVQYRESGAVAMACIEERAGSSQCKIRKFWAMHDGIVICLINTLPEGKSEALIKTALDQCRLRGPVAICDDNGIVAGAHGWQTPRPIRWLHHAGILYIPLGNISLATGPAAGSWKTINQNRSNTTITEAIFLPVLEHKPTQSNNVAGFVVQSCLDVSDAAVKAKNPSWQILRNDTICQAIRFGDGTLMAVFFEKGEFTETNQLRFKTDYPGVLLISNNGASTFNPFALPR